MIVELRSLEIVFQVRHKFKGLDQTTYYRRIGLISRGINAVSKEINIKINFQ